MAVEAVDNLTVFDYVDSHGSRNTSFDLSLLTLVGPTTAVDWPQSCNWPKLGHYDRARYCFTARVACTKNSRCVRFAADVASKTKLGKQQLAGADTPATSLAAVCCRSLQRQPST